MARRKESAKVHELRNTAQPCRAGGPELEFDKLEEAPDAPPFLKIEARKYWERIAPILIKQRVMTIADLESLEVLCILYGKVRMMEAAGVDISASTVTQLRLYQTEFGLTPASRNKVNADPDAGSGNRFGENGRKKRS